MTNTIQKRLTKKAQLIKLLSAKSGADIQTLGEKLGWQPHTTRAALSGLRRAGYQVIREEPAKGGPARYRTRSATTARQFSQLCGKLFDETGDRLTPSHSKTKAGKRLRYYVSHRLIAKSGEPIQGGWRLPAPELEEQLAALIRKTLGHPTAVSRLVPDLPADAIGRKTSQLADWLERAKLPDILRLVETITISPGQLMARLQEAEVAILLGADAASFSEEALAIIAPFQMRKRGVETKLILCNAPAGLDNKLICNMAKAHHWFAQIKAGKTFAEIAISEGISKRRIQQMIDLAFLAPDIIRDVLDGSQPVGFTSDWVKQHDLPSDWSAQRELLATL